MESAVGTISAMEEQVATVVVDAPLACPRCAAGKGCGAGIFQGADRRHEISVDIPAGMVTAVGDTIELRIGPKYLLRAAMLAYGLPLAGMFLLLLAGWLVSGPPGDLAGSLLAAAGLAGGFVAGRNLAGRQSICRQFVPTVGRVARDSAA